MIKFEQLCKDNYPRIYKYILGMIGNQEYAKDLTQEVFLIAYKKGDGFEMHDKPEAFLYKTAKNLVFAYCRRLQREVLQESDEDIPSHEGDLFEQLCKMQEDSIEDEKYKGEVLQQLSAKNRMLYEAYYMEHKSMREIAKILGISEVATRMKYVRLRKEIKNVVSDLKLGEF